MREELNSHIASLPDIPVLPATTGLAPLPSAGDLFTHWSHPSHHPEYKKYFQSTAKWKLSYFRGNAVIIVQDTRSCRMCVMISSLMGKASYSGSRCVVSDETEAHCHWQCHPFHGEGGIKTRESWKWKWYSSEIKLKALCEPLSPIYVEIHSISHFISLITFCCYW